MHQELPIKQAKRPLLHALDHNDVVILTAETGSGKTTQIPQYLIQAGYTIGDRNIAITVPRRIAALSICRRVCDQLGVYNNEIAHNVRFNSTVNDNTKVVFMTDGMLVQQLYSDPLLEKYSLIMLDDIHQKSLNCEILFGFLKKIIYQRKDKFKILITSATLQTTKLQAFFKLKPDYKSQKQISVRTINVPGRLHEVKINYLRENTGNYFLKAFQTLILIEKETTNGNILMFLTSVEEIQGMSNMIDSYSYQNRKRMKVLQLHAGIPLQKQTQIFEHCRDRKIILATNIAESSITIPDIQYVIDCGFVKVKAYDQEKGVDKMIVVPTGRSAAIQRAGRAGRVFDGECFRMYTEQSFSRMSEKIVPQILRVDLSSFLLKLLGLGIKDLLSFELLDKPPQKHYSQALDTLFAYQIVDEELNLTPKGKYAAELSLSIKQASMLLNSFSPKFGCSKEILMLVSMLQVYRDLYTNNSLALLKAKKKIGCKEGDFITLINMFLRYSRAKGPQDKRKVCGEMKISYGTMEHVLKIHDQILAQLKRFRKFNSVEQQMLIKYGDSEKDKMQSQKIQQFNNFQLKSSNDEFQAILRCIFTGFFPNIAQLQGGNEGSYLNIRSQERIQLHPTSILTAVYPEWIVYHQIVKSSANSYYIHHASKIQVDWITQLAGHYYQDTRKDRANQNYQQEQTKPSVDYQPKILQDENPDKSNNLVQVGGKKTKPELFKTNVLGLKDVKNAKKKNKLSFQEDLDL